MFPLLVFGKLVEEEMGFLGLIISYIACGVCACYVYVCVYVYVHIHGRRNGSSCTDTICTNRCTHITLSNLQQTLHSLMFLHAYNVGLGHTYVQRHAHT